MSQAPSWGDEMAEASTSSPAGSITLTRRVVTLCVVSAEDDEDTALQRLAGRLHEHHDTANDRDSNVEYLRVLRAATRAHRAGNAAALRAALLSARRNGGMDYPECPTSRLWARVWNGRPDTMRSRAACQYFDVDPPAHMSGDEAFPNQDHVAAILDAKRAEDQAARQRADAAAAAAKGKGKGGGRTPTGLKDRRSFGDGDGDGDVWT